jgi:bla regulator protein blaR1
MRLSGNLLLRSAVYMAIGGLQAQSPYVPDWQKVAGGQMAFEVASVKPTTEFKLSNVPLGPGDAKPPGGRFSAGMSLPFYINFAYKLDSNPEQDRVVTHLPDSLSQGLYEIEARAEGNPTKDQMRLMMQSLLADRFKLKVHYETREAPVFDLTLVKPGTTGPKLRPHSEGPPCRDSDTPLVLPALGALPALAPLKPGDVFPPNCDERGMARPSNGMQLAGARNITASMLTRLIYAYGSFDGEVDRAVVDNTGLIGTFDFTIEYSPENGGVARSLPPLPDRPNPSPPRESQGPSFLEAMRKQLGLKLTPDKGPVQILVVDHVEKPSDN